jgi:ELP3 family radical SAM enzyme/protein acetyltransferase
MFTPKFASTYTQEDIEGVFNKEMFKIDILDEEMQQMRDTFIKSHAHTFSSQQDYNKFVHRELHNRFPKTKMVKAYRILLKSNSITRNPNLEKYMRLKATRGNSGILQITTMMAGNLFGTDNNDNIQNGGCPHKCIYCPLEKIDGVVTQPRSYLTLEPANQRASHNKHHPVGQVFDRLNAFEKMGHLAPEPENPAKIEFMISGGTFNFFPEDYIIWFVTMSYYALNVYYDYVLTGELRDPKSLEEEQKINETSPIRMIGLTVETRPDYLTTKDDPYKIVRFFRRLGVTRVQTGVQHTDDRILKDVKRDCTDVKNQEGNKILMQNGFKVDNHWMLDLPGSTIEDDMKMIDYIFANPNYAVDQVKLYPTMVVEYSELYDMYQKGEYVPYAETHPDDMMNVIISFLKNVPYYMRVNRVIRDFFVDAIVGGVKDGNMRKQIETQLKNDGINLKDIRVREIKDGEFDLNDCHLFVDKYDACDGINYFISYENKSRTKLYGFTRLRLNKSTDYVIPELRDHALIRELHVYGVHTGVGNDVKHTQHRGLGKKLIATAEEIAALAGYNSISVISGIGVRGYYRKLGYSDYHTYLTKDIDLPIYMHYIVFGVVMFFALIFCLFI